MRLRISNKESVVNRKETSAFLLLLRLPTSYLALPFLMFGLAQMADGKKLHTRCGLCKAEAALDSQTQQKMRQPAHQSV